MIRNATLGAVLLATALTTGCVDRKFVVTSDPPNAAVYVNGAYVNQTPVDYPFVYYGKYEIKVVKDGFETIVDQKKIASPWYEIPPLDFFTDNFGPNIRDVRRIHYTLPERVPARETDLLDRALNLQTRGQAIGAPTVNGPLPESAREPGPVAPSSSPSVAPAAVAPPVTFPVAPAPQPR